MKITRIETTPMALPLRIPYNWHWGNQRGANLVLFTVETDQGVVGYGESISEEPAATAAYAALMARHIVDEEFDDVDAAMEVAWSSGRWKVTQRFSRMVIAGLESALWDAAGKEHGVPVSALLGEPVHAAIDFMGFPQGHEPTDLAAQGAAMAADGHSVIYIKAGVRGQPDEPKVAAVRDAIGDGVALRIDPNEAWDTETAVRTIRSLEKYDLDFVEQPVPADDVAALAEVRSRVSTRIAADQAVHTDDELARVLDAEAADVVVLGSGEVGGLASLRRMAARAARRDVEVNRHGWLESGISTFASLQVLSVIPNLTPGNQVMHQLLRDSTVTTPLPMAGGTIEVPTRPGLGFKLDDEVVFDAAGRFERDGAYPAVE